MSSNREACLTAGFQDPAPLAFGAAAPNTMFNAIPQRVLETPIEDRAAVANLLGLLDPDPVVREEQIRRTLGAISFCHPLCVHLRHLPRSSIPASDWFAPLASQ